MTTNRLSVIKMLESKTETKADLINILHVDDDLSILDVSKLMLKEMDSSLVVEFATGVDEALCKLKEKKYDIIISDYEMPQKNGLHFLKELKTNAIDTAFILFTGKGREEIAMQALNMGADGYYNKQGSPETVYGELAHGILHTVMRKRAEAKLRASELVTQKIVKSTPTLIYIFDLAENRNVYANKELIEFLGYTSEQVQSMGQGLFAKLLHPDDAKSVAEHHTRFLNAADNAVYELEYRMKHSNGQWRWLHSHDILFSRTQDGTGKQILGSCMDITERKGAEEALRLSEENFEAYIKSSPIAVFVANTDGKYEYVNSAATALLGYTQEELLEMYVYQVVQKEDTPGRRFNQLKEKGYFAEEMKLRRKNNTLADVSLSANKLPDGRLVAFCQDITERKNAEVILSRNEAHYRELYEQSPLGYQSLDADGYFIEVNQAWLNTLGYSREEVIGRWFGDFLIPSQAAVFKQRFPVFKSAGKIHSEFEMKHKDGSTVSVAFEGRIGYHENGDFKQTHCIMQEITQAKKAQLELESKYELLERFTDSIDSGLAIIDKDYRIIWVNSILAKAGFKLNQKCYEMIKRKNVCPDCGVRKVFEENAPFDVHEYKSVNSKGETRYLELRATPLKDKNGNVTSAIELVIPITERKKTEEKLVESEARYKSLFEQAGDYIFVLEMVEDQVPIIRDVNFAALKMHGYTREELVGKPLSMVDKEVTAEKLKQNMKHALLNVPFKFEAVHQRKDGTTFDVEAQARAVSVGAKTYIFSIERDITERKKNEAKMRESQLILENSSDSIIVTDLQGKITSWNKGSEHIFGYSANEIIGENITKIVKPQERTDVAPKQLDDIRGGKTFVQQWEGIRKDGSQIWLNLSTKLMLDEHNQPIAMVGFGKDITEYKQAETKLRLSEERLKKSQAVAHIAHWEYSVATGETIWSDEATRILGLTNNETASLEQFLSVIHPEDLEYVKQSIEAAVRGQQCDITYRIIQSDGKQRIIRDIAEVELDEKGNANRVFGTIQDITEFKRIEEDLQISANLVNLVSDSIHVVDMKGNLVYFNEATYKNRGYSREEMTKMTLHMLDAPESVELIEKRMQNLIQNGSATYESVQLCKNGTRVPVEIHARIIGSGENKLVLSIARDITDRKVAERELKESKERIALMNEKLRVVSSLTRHDVVNKLSVARTHSYLLKKRLKDDPELLKLIDGIDQSIDQSKRLLEVSKLYEKIGVEKIAEVNVEKAFTEAALLIGTQKIEVENKTQGLTVMADSMLSQLFYNLIDNSLKHGKTVSKISLSYSQTREATTLTYEDNGVGIPEENKQKIFVDGFTTGGSGLGLKLVKKMVEVYGWSIREEGTSGQGARFIITINS